MNRKQFLAVLAVLAVLVVVAVCVTLSDRSAWKNTDSRTGEKAISGLRIADVAEITIRDSTGDLHLVRGPSGWTLRERADFPADTDRVAAMLVALAEAKVVQSEPLADSQRVRLELAEPNLGDSARELGAPGTAVPARELVRDHRARVVTVALVLAARIAQPDHEQVER